MARPSITGKPMETRLVIRLSKEQKEKLEAEAKAMSMDLSVYARHILLKAARLGWR